MSIKKIAATLLTLGACVFMGSLPADAAKGFQGLSYMGNYLDRHPVTLNSVLPFFAEAEKAFPGKLSFNYFGSNTLFSEKECFDAVVDGRVDFGCVRSSMFPGKMNLVKIVDIPGVAPNAVVGSLVLQELINEFPEVAAEFPPNTTEFTAWTSAAYEIHTLKPVKTFEELKGKKLIVWDSVMLEVAKLLGANPIRLASTDTYLSLSKGMADGVICPIAPLRSYKITEATKYHTVINVGVGNFIMFANNDVWNPMPDDMKKWLKENGNLKLSLANGKALEDSVVSDTKWMMEQGHEFYYLEGAERAKFIEPLRVLRDAWAADCKAQGLPKVDEISKFVDERVAYHTEQMKKGVYGDYKM